MAEFIFDEVIKVVAIENLVVYDKVSRINAESEDGDFHLELDVHSELYPMLPGEIYRMLISSTLFMDGSTNPGQVPEGKQKSLADKFEYVMHGLQYKLSEVDKDDKNKDDKNKLSEVAKDDNRIAVYISFGGLQLMLKGNPLKMNKFKVDQRVFLLLRKI